MVATSSRTLQLLSLLQTQRYWPGTELAHRLDVSLRTLRRDIDRLRDLGYPVEAQRGVDGGYQLAPGATMPPLVVDDEEAVAVALGLLTGAESPVAGTAEASVRALGKVVQVMPKRLRRRVDALRATVEAATWGPPAATVDGETLVTVAQACRDSERLDFDYTAADQVHSQRRVEPHRLVSFGRNWYLVAYDLTRSDWRSFRLDRLTAARTTGSRFAPRDLPAADAAAFVRAGITHLPRPVVVDAVIAAPADLVRSRVGRWARVDEGADGTCRLRFSTGSLDWAALTLGATGADFSLQGPSELLEHLGSWSERFARATRIRDARLT